MISFSCLISGQKHCGLGSRCNIGVFFGGQKKVLQKARCRSVSHQSLFFIFFPGCPIFLEEALQEEKQETNMGLVKKAMMCVRTCAER